MNYFFILLVDNYTVIFKFMPDISSIFFDLLYYIK